MHDAIQHLWQIKWYLPHVGSVFISDVFSDNKPCKQIPRYDSYFQLFGLNWGASFRWSFGPLSAWGSIESTVFTTHPSLKLRTQKNDLNKISFWNRRKSEIFLVWHFEFGIGYFERSKSKPRTNRRDQIRSAFEQKRQTKRKTRWPNKSGLTRLSQ